MITTLIVALALAAQTPETDFEYPPPGNYRHPFKVEERYDRFRDATTLKVDLGVVLRPPGGGSYLELKVYQSYKGQGRLGRSGSPTLYFAYHSENGWRYLQSHQIILLLDGDQ